MNLQWQKTAAGSKKYGLVKGLKKPPSIFSKPPVADEEKKKTTKAQELEARRLADERRAEKLSADEYDYDGVYDSFQKTKEPQAKVKKARYIELLQEAAKTRQIDFDRVYERQLLKERENDDAGEKFVTSAYKKQLQELRKWDKVDELETRVQQQTTAEVAGMHGFYKNLLTKNIAAGADVSSNAVSSYTHGSKTHDYVTDKMGSDAAAAAEENEASKTNAPPKETKDDDYLPASLPKTTILDPAKKEEERVEQEEEREEAKKASPSEIKAQARARYLKRKAEAATSEEKE